MNERQQRLRDLTDRLVRLISTIDWAAHNGNAALLDWPELKWYAHDLIETLAVESELDREAMEIVQDE